MHAVEHQRFLKARQDARRAVRDAKDTWFRRKADEAQEGRSGGKKVWQSIRDMQQICRGDWCHRELATSRMKRDVPVFQVKQKNNDEGEISLVF